MKPVNLLLLVVVVLCAVSVWLGRSRGVDRGSEAAGSDSSPAIEGASGPVAADAPPDKSPGGDARQGGFLPDQAGRLTTAAAVHLVVLNGTGRSGLARSVGLALGSAGCVVQRVDNAPHDHFGRTLLINRRLAPERAEALAGILGDVPIRQERDERVTEDALLVLGGDWAQVCHSLGISPGP